MSHKAAAIAHSNAAATRIAGVATPCAQATTPVVAMASHITAIAPAMVSRSGLRGALAAAHRTTAIPTNMGDARRVMNCAASLAATPYVGA